MGLDGGFDAQKDGGRLTPKVVFLTDVKSDWPRDVWLESVDRLAAAGCEVVTPSSSPFANAIDFIEVLEDADALVVGLNPVHASVFEAGRRLKVVAKPGVGTDHIDLTAATQNGVVVCNTPGSNSSAVATHAIALLLGLYRNLIALNQVTHEGNGWREWPYIGDELTGKTVAVFGTGNIGQELIRKLVTGFDARVVAFDLAPNEALSAKYGVEYGSIGEILPIADAVVIHLPLTKETRGLFGPEQFQLMKRGSVFVNVARGGVVQEAALVSALENGRIAGAGIDVFEVEPAVSSGLFGIPNVILTPHVAGRSPTAARLARLMTVDNVLSCLMGVPKNVVNDQVLTSSKLRCLSPTPGLIRSSEQGSDSVSG